MLTVTLSHNKWKSLYLFLPLSCFKQTLPLCYLLTQQRNGTYYSVIDSPFFPLMGESKVNQCIYYDMCRKHMSESALQEIELPATQPISCKKDIVSAGIFLKAS